MMTDRKSKIRSLKARLKTVRESSERLNNELWWRSHSAILATRHGQGVNVALADSYTIQKGHGNYPTDPAGEQNTSRHIISTCPLYMTDIIARLEELFPELVP